MEDYNINKTCVAKSDHMMTYYSLNRKAVKWWKKLFFIFLTWLF